MSPRRSPCRPRTRLRTRRRLHLPLPCPPLPCLPRPPRITAMSKATCTAVIAEDEALLRSAMLEQLREAWPQLDIVAECEDGASALEAIDEHQPDVAFLDIRMPGLTGLEVAAAAAQASPHTQIVFVTAYDQYAIDAFDRGAIDYLLKPIARERLAATVQRLKLRAASGASDAAALNAVLERLGATLPRNPSR